MTKEEALRYLRTWARWAEPSDHWVRKSLVRIGQATPNDTVTHSFSTLHIVPEHMRGNVALLRQLCRIARVERLDLMRSISRCGAGVIEKCAARVIVKMNTEFSDDDFFVRLDFEGEDAKRALSRTKAG